MASNSYDVNRRVAEARAKRLSAVSGQGANSTTGRANVPAMQSRKQRLGQARNPGLPITGGGNVQRSGFDAEGFEDIIKRRDLTVPEPPGVGEGVLGTAVGVLNAFNFAMAGAAEEVFNPGAGSGKGVVKRVGAELFEIPRLMGNLFGLSITSYEAAQKEGFATVMEQGGVGEGGSISSVLPFLFSEDGAGWKLSEGGAFDITSRGTVGLAMDIAFDPTTYLTLGASSVSKGSKAVSIAARKKLASQTPSIYLTQRIGPKRFFSTAGQQAVENEKDRLIGKLVALGNRDAPLGVVTRLLTRRKAALNKSAAAADKKALAEGLAEKTTLTLTKAEERIIRNIEKRFGLTHREAKAKYVVMRAESAGERLLRVGAGLEHQRSVDALIQRTAEFRVATASPRSALSTVTEAGQVIPGAKTAAELTVQQASREISGMFWMGLSIPGTAEAAKAIRGGAGAVTQLGKNIINSGAQLDGFLGSISRNMVTLGEGTRRLFERFPNLRKTPEAIRIVNKAKSLKKFRDREMTNMVYDIFEAPFIKMTNLGRKVDTELKDAVHKEISLHVDDPFRHPIRGNALLEKYQDMVTWHKAIMNSVVAKELQHEMISPDMVRKTAGRYHPRSRDFWKNTDREISDAMRLKGKTQDAEMLLRTGSIGMHGEERVFDTIQDGINAGLTPRYDVGRDLVSRLANHNSAIGGAEVARELTQKFGTDAGAKMRSMWAHTGAKIQEIISEHLILGNIAGRRIHNFDSMEEYLAVTPTHGGAPRRTGPGGGTVVDQFNGEFVPGLDPRAGAAMNPSMRMTDTQDLHRFSASDHANRVKEANLTQAELDRVKTAVRVEGISEPLEILYNARLGRAWLRREDEAIFQGAIEAGLAEVPTVVRKVGDDITPGGLATDLSRREGVPVKLRHGGSFGSADQASIGILKRLDDAARSTPRHRKVVPPQAVLGMDDAEFQMLNRMMYAASERTGARGLHNFRQLNDTGKAIYLTQEMNGIKNFADLDDFLTRFEEHFKHMDSNAFYAIGGHVSERNLYKLMKKEDMIPFGTADAKKIGERLAKEGRKVPRAINQMKGMWLPRGIVEQLTETDDFIFPKGFAQILKNVDMVNNFFKMGVTLAFPAFHLRNAYSNIMQSFLDIGFQAVNVGRHAQTLAIMGGKDGTLVRKFGEDIPYQAVLDFAKRNGVLTTANDMIELKVAKGATGLRRHGVVKRLKSGVQGVENEARMNHFIGGLHNGLSVQEAAERTKKFLFDYGNLNATEKEFFSRLIPFYQWSRFNIPLQVESLAKRPGRVATLTKPFGFREGSPDFSLLPDYLRGDTSVTVTQQDGPGGGKRTYLYGIDLPFNDIEQLDTGDFGKFLRLKLAMTTPLLKGMFEIGMNKELFTNRAMSPRVNGFAGDIFTRLPAPVQRWLQVQKFTDLEGNERVSVNPLATYVLYRGYAFSRVARTAIDVTQATEDNTIDSWALQLMTGVRTKEMNFDEATEVAAKRRAKALEKFLIDKGVLQEFKRGFIRDDELNEVFPEARIIPTGVQRSGGRRRY